MSPSRNNRRSIVERLAVDTPAIVAPPRVEADASHDRLAHVMAVIRHFEWDYALGSAVEALAEAQDQTGPARRASVAKAMRHLAEELAYLDRAS